MLVIFIKTIKMTCPYVSNHFSKELLTQVTSDLVGAICKNPEENAFGTSNIYPTIVNSSCNKHAPITWFFYVDVTSDCNVYPIREVQCFKKQGINVFQQTVGRRVFPMQYSNLFEERFGNLIVTYRCKMHRTCLDWLFPTCESIGLLKKSNSSQKPTTKSLLSATFN